MAQSNVTNGQEVPSATYTWSNPPQRPKQIEALILGVERYDPTQVQVLEDYLASQFNEVFYDPLANFATLKLYQFNPDLVPLAAENPSNPIEAIHDSVTVKILLLSIAHRPFDSDFSLGMSMCGDRMGTLTLIGLLAQLSSVLQSRRFASFWTLLDSPEFQSLNPLISTIRDFDDLIRRSIGQSVASCFRSITLSRLQTYLGLSDLAEVRKWVEEFGWSIIEEKGQTVAKAQIPDNSDNRPVTTVTRENTTLEDLQQILAKSIVV